MKYNKNKITHRIYVVIIGYIALILGTMRLLNNYDCIINKIFGINCPTCGITRAGNSLLKLDFATAWAQNPLIYILILYIVFITLEYIAGKLKNSHLIFCGISFMIIAIIRWIFLIFVG